MQKENNEVKEVHEKKFHKENKENRDNRKKLLEEKVISIGRVTKVTKGGRTIPHEAYGKVGRANVLIKPAVKGTGVIAGGAARSVLELAGVKDVISKSLGSNAKINVAKATLEALKSERTPAKIAALRGKKVEEL